MRIIIAGFEHETNTFAPSKADLRAFELGGGWPGMVSGEALFAAIDGANIPAAGFVQAARAAGHTLVPTTWCAASPSAHVTREAYEHISAHILAQIREALPADAVYLDLHGAMVAEHIDDGEGELIARVRSIIGERMPLVVSLDLHANVTQKMLDGADAMFAFRTYPHVDMAETGARCLDYLQKRFQGLARQRPHWRRLPFLIPICWQSTFTEPARTLYRQLEALEAAPGVDGLSFCMGFPAADFAQCAGLIWAYGQDDAAQQAVDALYAAVLRSEPAFAGKLYDPDTAVREAMMLAGQAQGPVVIADAQDNPGAGSDSDTTGLLRALVRADARHAALGLIVDPAAAAQAHAVGVHQSVRLRLGGKSGVPGDEPLEADYLVEAVSDGRFLAQGPYYKGIHMSLGPSACLRLGGVRIVVTTDKAQMADQGLFRFVGIDPAAQDILVVKSSVHFRADFEPIAGRILIGIAPGSMKMDPAQLPWTRLPDALRLRPGGPTVAQWRAAQANSQEHSP